jgi:hypothetical protein
MERMQISDSKSEFNNSKDILSAKSLVKNSEMEDCNSSQYDSVYAVSQDNMSLNSGNSLVMMKENN